MTLVFIQGEKVMRNTVLVHGNIAARKGCYIILGKRKSGRLELAETLKGFYTKATSKQRKCPINGHDNTSYIDPLRPIIYRDPLKLEFRCV